MAFDDLFRLSVHAVFTNQENKILQVKSTYAGNRWGLPGGALEPGETIHQALMRECQEELAVSIQILYMSDMYYHKAYNSQACIFRCEMPLDAVIKLSSEHFILKPIGGPKLKLILSEVIVNKKFTDYCKFLGATMYDAHELEDTTEGVRITNTITVTSLLSFLWVKLVAKNVANDVPQQTDALVQLAKSNHD